MKTPQGSLELCILTRPLCAKCLLKAVGMTEAPLTSELPVLLRETPCYLIGLCIKAWAFPPR